MMTYLYKNLLHTLRFIAQESFMTDTFFSISNQVCNFRWAQGLIKFEIEVLSYSTFMAISSQIPSGYKKC